MARAKGRGLTYLRRSTDKQEISLPSQLDWAIGAARQHGVVFDATLADLAHMQLAGLHSHKAIRLDDGISGADLTRPGFKALLDDALADPGTSHIFVYKRDRFARPDDAMLAAQIEKRLLQAGVTIVLSDAVVPPIRRGEQNILRDLELLLAYYQGGEELRKHAERVLLFQRVLAEGGYRVGGNAPYGFGRVLVDAGGNVLEELPPGKTVRQPGCHVRVAPKDPEKIAVWLQILEWKAKGRGAKWIAGELNDRGVPSPDAGRTRTDHGVKHYVSGKWNPNTVAELCRNPIILGVQEYGKRSEGKIRRLGSGGPRLLEEDKDLSEKGQPRVVINDPSLRTSRRVGEVKFDPGRWEAIQLQMDERGETQRGVARAKDPARYPLACLLVDLSDGCGSVLYGRTTDGRAVYSCGRYMRTAGAECARNSIDAEAMLRFTLRTLKQLVDRGGNRDKLRQKLLERAKREAREPAADPRLAELARLKARRADLLEQRATIEHRMARERDDDLYAALTRQFSTAKAELAAVEDSVRRLEAEQPAETARSPEAQAESALGLLDDVTRVAGNPAARAEVRPLLQRLGVRIGLSFVSAIKGKKRVVQRLMSGRMVFGGRPLPVPLFGKENAGGGPHSGGALPPAEWGKAEDQNRLSVGESAAAAASDVIVGEGRNDKQAAGAGILPAPAAAVGDRSPARPNGSRPEGVSITKVSRGERI
jgi:hypothetical protein